MDDFAHMQQVLDGVRTRIRDLGWAGITQEERDAVNVDALYGCVNNGGIDALFFNSQYLGDMIVELLDALERVGATRAAAVIREATALFPDARVPATLDARVEWLRRSTKPDPFEEASRRFYREAEQEESVLFAFFRRHPRIFAPEF